MPKGPPPRVHTTRGRLSCGAEQMGPSVSDAGRGGSHVRLEVSYPGDRLWTVLLAAASLHVGLAASCTVARAHWSQLHCIPLQGGGQGYGWPAISRLPREARGLGLGLGIVSVRTLGQL